MTNISSGEDPAIQLAYDQLVQLRLTCAKIKDKHQRIVVDFYLDNAERMLGSYLPEE